MVGNKRGLSIPDQHNYVTALGFNHFCVDYGRFGLFTFLIFRDIYK